MKQKRLLPLFLCLCLLFVLPVKVSAADNSEQETSAAYLREQGIMVGDGNGEMNLDSGLTRAQLATVLTRLHGNPEHVQVDQAFYTGQCKFPDVPEWARLYVGYCYANGLMVGYDTGAFGADDGVTPAAACTVVLRYMDLPDTEWDYCATCDGEFFTGKDVFVVGGGFAAAEESVFLTKYARQVTILIRGDDFTCAQATADAARNHEKITVLTNTEVEEVSGDTSLRYLRYRNTKTGQVTKHHAADGETFGVFVFAGYEPATELVRGLAELNDQGYILTDRSQKTTADGLYAAGDVCVKPLRQVVTAVGDGALAATELEHLCAAMQEKTGIHPKAPVSRAEETAVSTETNSTLFTGGMPAQLHTVFARMAAPLVLRLYLDETPLSAELKQYMEELAAQSSKLTAEIGTAEEMEHLPCVRVCRPDGSWTGLAFHGVPGGHEFTSFVLGLYNAAGPGQALDEDTRAAIQSVQKPIKLEILVSLSCTMCPELVTAAQRIAAENPHITAQVYDLNHFPDLRERYQVMSVPCLVINDGAQVSFGKKNIRQLLELLT